MRFFGFAWLYTHRADCAHVKGLHAEFARGAGPIHTNLVATNAAKRGYSAQSNSFPSIRMVLKVFARSCGRGVGGGQHDAVRTYVLTAGVGTITDLCGRGCKPLNSIACRATRLLPWASFALFLLGLLFDVRGLKDRMPQGLRYDTRGKFCALTKIRTSAT